jgi:uncharacterized UBP type Zn finger protein
MKNLVFHHTSQVITSENYPYGFRLKTTKHDSIEFKKGHGFRHVSQTINPKNGQLNKPKKSTYYQIMLLAKNEIGHVEVITQRFYSTEDINETCKFLHEQFTNFTDEQIKDIASTLLLHLLASIKAMVIYTGAEIEQVKPLYDSAIETCKKIMNTGANNWQEINLDCTAIESCKKPDFNPFVITNYGV